MKKWLNLFHHHHVDKPANNDDADVPDADSDSQTQTQHSEEVCVQEIWGGELPMLVRDHDEFDAIVNQKIEDFLDRFNTDDDFNDETIQLYTDLREQSTMKRQLIKTSRNCQHCVALKHQIIQKLEMHIHDLHHRAINPKFSPQERAHFSQIQKQLKKYLQQLQSTNVELFCAHHREVFVQEHQALEAILERVLNLENLAASAEI